MRVDSTHEGYRENRHVCDSVSVRVHLFPGRVSAKVRIPCRTGGMPAGRQKPVAGCTIPRRGLVAGGSMKEPGPELLDDVALLAECDATMPPAAEEELSDLLDRKREGDLAPE